jgi:hypothetical protein
MADPLTMGLVGLSAAKTLFGGGQIGVPGAIAQPTRPDILAENGLLKDQFRLTGNQEQGQTNAQGLISQLTDSAQSDSPSPYARRQLEANDTQRRMQLDRLNNQQASSLATSQANLAMKGGLSSGASERLAQANNTTGLNQRMGINSQSSLNNLNTLAQDENRKLGLTKDLIGLNMDQARFNTGLKQFDIGNALSTQNNFYNQDMQRYGANQLARSQAQAHNAANKGLLGGLF